MRGLRAYCLRPLDLPQDAGIPEVIVLHDIKLIPYFAWNNRGVAKMPVRLNYFNLRNARLG